MVEKKDVKATVKAAAEIAKSAEAKTGAKPATPEKVETKAEAAVPVKAETAPAEKEARTAPARKTTARKTVAKTTSKKETAPKEATKKEAAPKVEAEKEAATKAAAKKETAKKTPAKKAVESEAAVHLQLDGKDLVVRDVLDRAVKAFKKSHRGVEIKAIDLCVVANEGAAYYVMNGEGGDDYKIILQFRIKD